MRKILSAIVLLGVTMSVPAIAQSSVEGRVGKLEGEMRAVQRKVFPGGAGPYLEPQITPGEAPLGPAPGTPANSALIDLSSRVTSLESQMATLTGQIEQSQNRLRQLEESFAAYRKANDARLSERSSAPAPSTAITGSLENGPAPRPTASPSPTTIVDRAGPAAAVDRPDTGDAAEDAYLYGYRLWAAKRYPDAEAQLKKTVADYPKHRRASYAQNLLGRSYLDDGKPSLASIAFYDNYKKNPDGERAPDSLYFLGQSLMKLNKPADACKVYGELTDVYGTKIDAAMKTNVEKDGSPPNASDRAAARRRLTMPRARSQRAAVAPLSCDDRDASRFLLDLARAAGTLPDRIALAVSGGADSMAMLALAAAALPGRIVVATVDHRLRTASAEEAAMVARHCATINVPHAILVPTTPIAGASIQSQAREARYALLARWARARDAGCIATAHHADDQAETFLMRAARGSGLAGLAGIRRRVEIDGVVVVRPLLKWRRAELRAIVRRAGLVFVDDPANADPRHDRTRFRTLLEHNEWLDPPALAEAAAHLAETDADLRATIAWLWAERAEADDSRVDLDVADLPMELRRRLVRRAISEVRRAAHIDTPAWSEATGIEPLLAALSAGKGATQAGVVATIKGARWRFRQAPPRRRT